jgi:hypothetical protein
MGHNEAAARHIMGLLRSTRTRFAEKIDGALLLGVYAMSPILVLGWLIGIVLWYLGVTKPGLIVILAVVSYSALGNFATFFEIAAAAHLDGSRNRIRLLPFVFLGFLVSLFGVSRATLSQLLPHKTRSLLWHKTERDDNNHGHGYHLRNGFNGRTGDARAGSASGAARGDVPGDPPRESVPAPRPSPSPEARPAGPPRRERRRTPRSPR